RPRIHRTARHAGSRDERGPRRRHDARAGRHAQRARDHPRRSRVQPRRHGIRYGVQPRGNRHGVVGGRDNVLRSRPRGRCAHRHRDAAVGARPQRNLRRRGAQPRRARRRVPRALPYRARRADAENRGQRRGWRVTDIAVASTPEKTRVAHDRESILLGAVEVFNRRGYDATSMGVLAENLGITKSAIYHHVPSKEYLLELALDRALGGLEGVLADPLATTGPAVSRLDFVLRGATEVLTQQLPFVTLLLRLRGNTELERAALDRRRAFNRGVADLVEEAQSDGAL